MAQLETGAAGTVHFEPGVVAFRDDINQKPDPRCDSRIGALAWRGGARAQLNERSLPASPRGAKISYELKVDPRKGKSSAENLRL